MEIKKVLGIALTLAGTVALAAGVIGIFNGKQLIGINSWALAILGLFFFTAGVRVIRSIRGAEAD